LKSSEESPKQVNTSDFMEATGNLSNAQLAMLEISRWRRRA